MFKISLLVLLVTAIFSIPAAGQKKVSRNNKKAVLPKNLKLLVKPLPPKIIEIENWQEFSFEENDFKINFPKTPETNRLETKELDTPVTLYTYQAAINDSYFLVNISQYPKDFLPRRNDLGEHFGSWLKEFILDEQSILGERYLDWDGYSGAEFVYRQGTDEIIIHRIYVIDQKLCQLMIHLKANKGETLPETVNRNKTQIDKFFDSFTINKASGDNLNG